MKKRLRAFVGVLVAGSLLATAACSGSASTTDGKVELVIWHQESPPNRVERWQSIIDDFNESQSKVHVTQKVKDWSTIYSVAPAAIASKTGPDVLMVMPELSTYIRRTGAVQPVTSLVEELGDEYSYLPAATDPYYDEGEYWGVPLWGMVQLLWYRKSAFEKAGITEPPTTWEETLAYADKLTSGSQYGITLPASKTTATDQTFFTFMKTYQAEDVFDENGEVAFDNPNLVRALDMYDKLLGFASPDSANYSWGEPEAAFNNGSAAMLVDKGIMLSIYGKDSTGPTEDLGCAPIPQPAEGGQPGSHYASNAAMVLTSDPDKQEAAAEFIRYILQPDVYGPWLNAEPGLFLPVTEGGFESESWLSDPALTTWPECTELLQTQSESGGLYGFTSGRYESDIGPIAAQNLIAQTVQKVVVDDVSPEDAAAWGQAQMQAAIK